MALNHNDIPLVIFSGGFDSTFLLYLLLGQYAQVDIVSVELSGQPKKTARETAAIGKLAAALHRKHRKDPVNFGQVRSSFRVTGNGAKHGDSQMPMGQAPIWMAVALQFVTSKTHEVHIGYVKGDDQAVTFTHIQEAWEKLMDVCGAGLVEDRSRPKLKAPLIFATKEDILKSGLPKLFNYVSWCESVAKENDCGICSSCQRMMKAINTWQFMYPDSYSESGIYKGRFTSMVRKWRASQNKRTTLLQ